MPACLPACKYACMFVATLVVCDACTNVCHKLLLNVKLHLSALWFSWYNAHLNLSGDCAQVVESWQIDSVRAYFKLLRLPGQSPITPQEVGTTCPSSYPP